METEEKKIEVYVVTIPDAGWDCVRGVYLAENEEEVYTFLYYDRNGPDAEPPTKEQLDELEEIYIVHPKQLRQV